MPSNKILSFLTIFLILLFSATWVLNASNQDSNLTKAIQLFERGDYKNAEPLFKELIDADYKNPLLNYYYGSCLTENEVYSDSAIQYLLNSDENNVPLKKNFYLGIQYQAQGKWEQALRYYNKFRVTASKSEQSDLQLAERIQQCYNQENPFRSMNLTQSTKTDSSNVLVFEDNTDSDLFITTDSAGSYEINDNGFLEDVKINPEGIPIEFRINGQLVYKNTNNFRTDEAKKLFTEGEKKQKELEAGMQRVNELRNDYRQAVSDNQKKILGEEILSLENESYQLKDEINELYRNARDLESEYWQKASSTELMEFKQQLAENEKQEQEDKTSVEETQPKSDSAIIDPQILLNKLDVQKPPEEKPMQDELVYKIQIGAYSRKLPTYVDRLYKKLSVIRKIDNYTDENGVTVYTTGNLTNLSDAIKMQTQVRQEGVEDAFVVPYFNGKRITLQQAKEIEKKR